MKRILLFIGLKIVEIVPFTLVAIVTWKVLPLIIDKWPLWCNILIFLVCVAWLIWVFCFVKCYKWIPEFIKANWKWAGKILERTER